MSVRRVAIQNNRVVLDQQSEGLRKTVPIFAVERELYREHLYNILLGNVGHKFKSERWNLKFKSIAQMMLRYVFVKIMMLSVEYHEGEEYEDPVFIGTECDEANKQIITDVMYQFNQQNPSIFYSTNEKTASESAIRIMQYIHREFVTVANLMQKAVILEDQDVCLKDSACLQQSERLQIKNNPVVLDSNSALFISKRDPDTTGTTVVFSNRKGEGTRGGRNQEENSVLQYGKITYKNHANLITVNSTREQRHKGLALGIRYSYLNLWNQGLARRYQVDMHLTPQDGIEGFASSFNHYFDEYHSAFPDLESVFGSKGSFFAANLSCPYTYKTYHINPPFDETVMTHMVAKVLQALSNGSSHTFISVLPGSWSNFKALEDCKSSIYLKQHTFYKKGELAFLDYMKNNLVVYPCDISELRLHL